MASCHAVLLTAVMAGSLLLKPSLAQAQWWSRAPADFEACADTAEKAATRDEKAAALSQCNAKFAGRRKPGGGYSYYDFMQNRSFDIAGPNPTPQEQKHIDEQYTAFLDQERRNSIAAAALAARQQQLQEATFRSEPEKVPLPMRPPRKPPAAAGDSRARAKPSDCADHSFSCEWPRLSESLKDLKKLFGSSQGKAKGG